MRHHALRTAVALFPFVLLLGLATAFAAAQKPAPDARYRDAQQIQQTHSTNLDAVYREESHCLTDADLRGDGDRRITCWCRDAVVDARYVYFTYLVSGKDHNLNGVFLALETRVADTCGVTPAEALHDAERDDWKWNGPEVVRTYPSDEVIARITPETRDGRPVGRWVPFTIQLVYRDGQGRVTRTENYTSREFVPVFK